MFDKSVPILQGEDEREVEIDFKLVPTPIEEELSEKQLFHYRNKREKLARWLLEEGKNPSDREGYAESTVTRTLQRISVFERWVWNQHGEYTSTITTDEADEFITQVAQADKSQSHKHHTLHSIKRFFKWKKHKKNGEAWDPDQSFNVSDSQTPQDHLTKAEREQLRDVSLKHGSIPSYYSLQSQTERRERLKPYVAEYVGKPVEQLGIDDWQETDVPSWKVTSMVWASLDCGLRPDEVRNAKVQWVDVDNDRLLIPAEDASKSDDNWEVALLGQTADVLANWIHERSHYPKYDDTDRLWLTKYGNPYRPKTLGRLLRRLCDEAGINYEHRRMSWYSIRHSVGTYMTQERDLAATQSQLRHKVPKTTMKYDQTPNEDRREALDKMG